MTRLTLLLALCALSCASPIRYDRPDATPQERAQARLACELLIVPLLPRRSYQPGITIDLRRRNAKVRAMHLCMLAKGWQREERDAD